ncbi:MAG: hypothetical protein GY865_13890 [candidate division Zixibacteria bacterium]|nr:hypothetical protein [candidate division Zixibacteria bacterium]
MSVKYQLNKNVGLILLILGIVAHISQTYYFNFTQDDAFITFRYAANFLNGDGLVFNIGERVEGYTNFLWLIFVIVGKQAGFEFVIFSKILGVFCGIGVIYFTFLIGQIIFDKKSYLPGLCSFILGTVLSFGYWSVAGLETAAFSMMVTGAIYYYLRRSYLIIPFLVLATLLRPEGGLVFGIIILHNIISTKSFTKYALAIISAFGLLLMPYAIFKLFYFHALLPNPFYAKTGFNLSQLYNGLEYTGTFFWHYLGGGLFLLPFLLTYKKWSSSIKTIALFLVIYIFYITLIGGDVLKVHRFFVALFPGVILVCVYGFNKLCCHKVVFWVVLLLLVGWQNYFPTEFIHTYHRAELALNNKMNKTIDQMLAIDNSNFSIAVSTIGIVGYRLMGHTVIDLLGLTDSTIARHPEQPISGLTTTWKEESYNSEYVLSRQPDYILFSTEFKPSAPAERALFLYTEFLRCYRTIGFHFDEVLHSIYKRYYPIEGPIKRDVDVEFVQKYYIGIDLWSQKKFDEAIAELNKAINFCPSPKYPYPYYLIADANRELYKLEIAYNMLNKLVSTDTLVYEAYKDLFIFEYAILNNMERAEQNYKKVGQLTPWYLSRLENVAKSVKQSLIYESGASVGGQ